MNTSIHSVTANLIKNKIKFSVIEFDQKSFIYETICKLTGGLHINYNLQGKKQLFFWFKNKFLKNIPSYSKNYLSLVAKRTKFFCLQNKEKHCYLLKILNYCPVCKTLKTIVKNQTCINCGVLFLNSNLVKSYNFKYIDLNIYEIFSIFSYHNTFNLFIFLNKK